MTGPLERALDAVSEWQARGGRVPPPFSHADVLSGEFLLIGRLLFRIPSVDAAIEEARAQFDAAARNALARLYRLLGKVERVPEPIRAILARHQDRFESFTQPD